MEKISIQGSPKTPTVNFDPVRGYLEIRGRSIPENSVDFYQPLFDSLGVYASKPQSATNVKIDLEYYNSSSSKCIVDLLKVLENIQASHSGVTINWYYDKDDKTMHDAGEDYQNLIKIPFNIIEKEG